MYKTDSLASDELIRLVQNGAVGVLPTDTLYGLVCAASNQEAVARLYELKSCDKKPGTLIAASIQQLVDLGIPRRYLTAVEHFWPNPISVVIPSLPQLAYLDLGKMSLAVRIPSEGSITTLLNKTGPLVTTSANTPGTHPAKDIVEAERYFGEKVDFYVDGGDLDQRIGSTIIRVVDDAVEVLRQGAVTVNEKGEIQS